MTIAILATGDEITHGDTLNTTSQHFANALSCAGFSMGMHLVCGDKHTEIMQSLAFLGQSHETLIITGGLGPTSDDRTRFAVADYIEKPLVHYDVAVEHIKERLQRAQCPADSGQAQQALFPDNATLLPNPNGTAMGCLFETDTHVFVLLPGPPNESLPMFDDYVLPELQQKLQVSDKVCLKWVLKNVPEGATAEKIESALKDIPCEIGYRLMKPDLEFKVRCTRAYLNAVEVAIAPLLQDDKA